MTGRVYCRACEEEIPQGARFCPICGASVAPEPQAELDICEIVLWRGYVKAGFYAVGSPNGEYSSEESLRSPLFRAKRGQVAEEGPARDAHSALVERLLAEGWEPVGRGPAWYSQVFGRPTTSHALHVDAGQLARDDSVPVIGAAPNRANGRTGFVPTELPRKPELDLGHVKLAEDPAPAQGAMAPQVALRQPSERVRNEEGKPTTPVPVPAAEARALTKKERDHGSEWLETEVAPRRTKRRIRIGVVTLAAAIGGVSAALGPSLLASQPAKGHPPLAQPPGQALQSKPTTSSVTKTRESRTRVVLAATRGSSRMEARAGSPTGRIIYRGILKQGQTERMSAHRVWLRLAQAGNVDVLVNGKPPRKALLGTVGVVLGPQ